MSRVEELFEILPPSIIIEGKKYVLNVWKIEDFKPFKYGARYGLTFEDENGPQDWPANVLVTDEDGSKGYEFTISMDNTLEGTLEDLYRRIKDYIENE